MDSRQTGEDQFLRNLVDQRDAETFVQVHQNLKTTHKEDDSMESDQWGLVAAGGAVSSIHLVPPKCVKLVARRPNEATRSFSVAEESVQILKRFWPN